jgi:hypothetical protein
LLRRNGGYILPAGLTGDGNVDKDITWMFAGKGGSDPYADGQLFKDLGFTTDLYNEMGRFKSVLIGMHWPGFQVCSL